MSDVVFERCLDDTCITFTLHSNRIEREEGGERDGDGGREGETREGGREKGGERDGDGREGGREDGEM